MIPIKELEREDLKILMEGFDHEFLINPLLHPSKGLNQFIPKGFRIKSLSRNQVVKLYVDALKAGEVSVTRYIESNIERNFKEDGLIDIVESYKKRGEHPAMIVGELTVILLEKGYSIPAYIVLLLAGNDCSEEVKRVSTLLRDYYCESIEEAKKSEFEKGYEKGKSISISELSNEKKATVKAKKAYEDLQKKKKGLEEELKQQKEWIEELETEIESKEQKILQISSELERATANNIQLENQVALYHDLQQEKLHLNTAIDKLSKELKGKEEHIHNLNIELDEAHANAYSNKVLQTLCADVVDEIQASSLSRKEILQIAKGRFAEQETIIDAWNNIGNESNTVMNSIIEQFTANEFNDNHLDQLEEIEDGELIRFSIIKSLKAILFHSLEQNELKDIPSSRFGGTEKNED